MLAVSGIIIPSVRSLIISTCLDNEFKTPKIILLNGNSDVFMKDFIWYYKGCSIFKHKLKFIKTFLTNSLNIFTVIFYGIFIS